MLSYNELISLPIGNTPLLCYSGGRDSSFLLEQISKSLNHNDYSAITLSFSNNSFDLKRSESLALISERPIHVVLERQRKDLVLFCRANRDLIQQFGSVIHKILVIAEGMLFEYAANNNYSLITGHGPEAIFGGYRFNKYALPATIEGAHQILLFDKYRLNLLSNWFGVEHHAPLMKSQALGYMIKIRNEGADGLPLEVLKPNIKRSFQVGCGLHGLISTLAKTRRQTRGDFINSLL